MVCDPELRRDKRAVHSPVLPSILSDQLHSELRVERDTGPPGMRFRPLQEVPPSVPLDRAGGRPAPDMVRVLWAAELYFVCPVVPCGSSALDELEVLQHRSVLSIHRQACNSVLLPQ